MRILTFFVVSLFLFGCSPEIDGWKIRAAEKYCADLDGIDHISNINDGGVVCGNGEFKGFRELRP